MEAVGVGASVAAATNIFSYNRDAWMTDVQVRQNRRIQKQQMLLSQYQMFREDIRDTVGSNITRQNNYIVIATLLLGMMGECFIEGPISVGASNFLQATYKMCITSSLVYLVLSVLCAIGANHLAVGWQRSLLTRQVRLPIQEMIRELDENAADESVESFERQGFSTILRVPGLSRLQGAAATSGRTSSASVAPVAEADGPPPDGAQCPHILLFKKHAASFEQLEELCMLFGAMGLHHLLQGYAFFAAASYYDGRYFSSFTVPLTIALIDAILTCAFFTKGGGGWGKTGMAFSVGAILFAVVGIRVHGRWDDMCICLSFACEAMTNILGHFKLKSATQLQSDYDRSSDCEDEAIRTKPTLPSQVSQFKVVSKSAMVASTGTLIVITAWMSMLGWVLIECSTNAIRHGHESTESMKQKGRSLRGLAVGGSSWDFEPLAVTLPDDHFVPSALACAGASSAGSGAQCVLANEFVVFQFRDLDSAGASGSQRHALEHVPCNISGSILDVALECGDDVAEGKPCRTLVLVRGPAQTAVVDCAKGEAQPLIEAVPGSATHLAASPFAPGVWSGARGSLLTVQAGKDGAATVVRRGRVEPDLGSWAPLWTLAKLPGRELAAVRAVSVGGGGGPGRWLLVGSADGLLELFDLQKRSLQQAAFAVPGPQPLLAAGRLVSAAPVAGGSALVLLGPSEGEEGVAGDVVRLGRVRWPQGFALDW